MSGISPRSALAPLALLALSASAYALVLGGIVPVPVGADAALLAIAGATTIAAAIIRATLPAVTAGVATLGFALGFASGPLLVDVAAALAILGGLGFLASVTRHAMKRGTATNFARSP